MDAINIIKGCKGSGGGTHALSMPRPLHGRHNRCSFGITHSWKGEGVWNSVMCLGI